MAQLFPTYENMYVRFI